MRRSVAVLALALVLSAPLFAQQRRPQVPDARNAVTIKVRLILEGNASQNRIPRFTRVELLNSNNIFVREKQTDEMGQVEFENCDAGVYRVRISGEGIVTKYSDLFSADPRENMHFEMVLVSPSQDANVEQEQKPVANAVSALEINVPGNAAREFRRGVHAMEQREWEKAQRHFEAAVAAYPSYPSAYNNLGVVFMTLGNTAQGAKAFERAVELDPKYARASFNLAKVRFAANDLPAAEQLLTSALATDPGSAEILLTLANVQLVRGEYAAAAANGQRVHQLEHARFAVAHFISARAFLAQQKNEEAAAEVRLFLQEAPNDALGPQARQLLAQLEKH